MVSEKTTTKKNNNNENNHDNEISENNQNNVIIIMFFFSIDFFFPNPQGRSRQVFIRFHLRRRRLIPRLRPSDRRRPRNPRKLDRPLPALTRLPLPKLSARSRNRKMEAEAEASVIATFTQNPTPLTEPPLTTPSRYGWLFYSECVNDCVFFLILTSECF